MTIEDLLFTGKEKAQRGKDIANRLGITVRDFTQQVERERKAGAPICATKGNNPGYFLAANKEEMENYCNVLKKEAISLFVTRQACLKAIEKLPE